MHGSRDPEALRAKQAQNWRKDLILLLLWDRHGPRPWPATQQVTGPQETFSAGQALLRHCPRSQEPKEGSLWPLGPKPQPVSSLSQGIALEQGPMTPPGPAQGAGHYTYYAAGSGALFSEESI